MITRTSQPASGAMLISEMKEFAAFPKATQRYIRRSLDVAYGRRDAIECWARDEGEAASGNEHSERVFQRAKSEGAQAVVISAAIEAEIATLPAEERDAFLSDLGLHETGLNRMIHAAYALLGLITFYTAGPKESRAWTVHKGAKAPEAAGEIHTDFERGFIRAETIAYDDYIQLGGEIGAKDAGKMRSEGKDYVVQDGDIMLFRFNV